MPTKTCEKCGNKVELSESCKLIICLECGYCHICQEKECALLGGNTEEHEDA